MNEGVDKAKKVTGKTVDFGYGVSMELRDPRTEVDAFGFPAWRILIHGSDADMATRGINFHRDSSLHQLYSQVEEVLYNWVSSSAVDLHEAEIHQTVDKAYDEYQSSQKRS